MSVNIFILTVSVPLDIKKKNRKYNEIEKQNK